MKVVIALGGNALIQRGEKAEYLVQVSNVKKAVKAISKIVEDHEVIIVHGNGPQVGLLSNQNDAYGEITSYPFDVLVAQTQSMIGYIITQAFSEYNINKKVLNLLTRVEVNENDSSFQNPTKFIGMVYNEIQAKKLIEEKGWIMKADGEYFRRVVPSPIPKSILELSSIETLVKDHILICAGGGGIAVKKTPLGYDGVEAVIDKDLSASLLAQSIGAEALIILSDVEAVYENFGKENEKKISNITVEEIGKKDFPKGSMGPKVEAISEFVSKTNGFGAIGKLDQLELILEKKKGTIISLF